MFKKILSTLLVFLFIFVTTISVSARSISDDKKYAEVSVGDFSDADLQFLNKFTSVLDGYFTNKNGEISFRYTANELRNKGFTTDDVDKLNEINNKVCGAIIPEEDTFIQTRMFVEGGKIYFDNVDVKAVLLSAATLGPEALYAALVGLGSLAGGPVGSVITAVLGAIGAASLSYLCYLIIQAAANDQGIYIGFEMNGIFPNIVTGTW